MIVAGFGCMAGCSVEELLTVLRAAEASCGVKAHILAAPRFKQREAGLVALSGRLAMSMRWMDDAAMDAVADLCRTHSAPSLRVAGVPSVAEASALAAAGEGARLIQPRIAHPRATCALAESGE